MISIECPTFPSDPGNLTKSYLVANYKRDTSSTPSIAFLEIVVSEFTDPVSISLVISSISRSSYEKF